MKTAKLNLTKIIITNITFYLMCSLLIIMNIPKSYAYTAQDDSQVVYLPHIEFNPKIGSKRHIGRARAFIPFLQNANSLFFTNLIGMADSERSTEFNVGLGYRQMINDSFILGAYSFWDLRKTQNDNYVNQATIGGELFTDCLEFRANGYIPFKKSFSMNTGARVNVNFNGHRTFYKRFDKMVKEYILSGFDVEVGSSVPNFEKLKGYATYYRFQRGSKVQINGVRGRVNYEFFKWLKLEGEASYDNVRNSQFYIGVKLTHTFFAKEHHKSLTPLQQKMTIMPERDIDIVAHAQQKTKPKGAFSVKGFSPMITDDGVPGIESTGNGSLSAKEIVAKLSGSGLIIRKLFSPKVAFALREKGERKKGEKPESLTKGTKGEERSQMSIRIVQETIRKEEERLAQIEKERQERIVRERQEREERERKQKEAKQAASQASFASSPKGPGDESSTPVSSSSGKKVLGSKKLGKAKDVVGGIFTPKSKRKNKEAAQDDIGVREHQAQQEKDGLLSAPATVPQERNRRIFGWGRDKRSQSMRTLPTFTPPVEIPLPNDEDKEKKKKKDKLSPVKRLAMLAKMRKVGSTGDLEQLAKDEAELAREQGVSSEGGNPKSPKLSRKTTKRLEEMKRKEEKAVEQARLKEEKEAKVARKKAEKEASPSTGVRGSTHFPFVKVGDSPKGNRKASKTPGGDSSDTVSSSREQLGAQEPSLLSGDPLSVGSPVSKSEKKLLKQQQREQEKEEQERKSAVKKEDKKRLSEIKKGNSEQQKEEKRLAKEEQKEKAKAAKVQEKGKKEEESTERKAQREEKGRLSALAKKQKKDAKKEEARLVAKRKSEKKSTKVVDAYLTANTADLEGFLAGKTDTIRGGTVRDRDGEEQEVVLSPLTPMPTPTSASSSASKESQRGGIFAELAQKVEDHNPYLGLGQEALRVCRQAAEIAVPVSAVLGQEGLDALTARRHAVNPHDRPKLSKATSVVQIASVALEFGDSLRKAFTSRLEGKHGEEFERGKAFELKRLVVAQNHYEHELTTLEEQSKTSQTGRSSSGSSYSEEIKMMKELVAASVDAFKAVSELVEVIEAVT